MSTTWDTIRRRAGARYGLAAGAEDALLNEPLFLARVNELLQEVAENARAFRQEFTIDLPTSNPTALDSRVLDLIEQTMRADTDGDGVYETEIGWADEQRLRREWGVVENLPAGTPCCYFTQRGSVAGAMLGLVLLPVPSTARTNGLKFSAYVYPAAITQASDALPLQLGEERFLIPGICYCLAQVEASRGRRDAPLAFWQAEWAKSLADWIEAVEETLQGDVRRIHRVDGYTSAFWP